MQYTAEAKANGDGRNGKVSSTDGMINLPLGIPSELGGAGGEASNPEQLFAAGYAGCFMSALSTVARHHRVKLLEPSVTAQVTIASGDDGFNLSVKLLVDLPGVEAETAQVLLDGAHAKCPYSRAVRGNIPVLIERV
jgi:osmotically inducible protein OsmC